MRRLVAMLMVGACSADKSDDDGGTGGEAASGTPSDDDGGAASDSDSGSDTDTDAAGASSGGASSSRGGCSVQEHPPGAVLLVVLLIGIAGLALPGIQGILTIAFAVAMLSLSSRWVYAATEKLLSRWPRVWDRVVRLRRWIHGKLLAIWRVLLSPFSSGSDN